nr:restriction endonuclease subunit S [Rhodoferax sp.]
MTTWDSVALGDLCSLITDGKHGDCTDEQDSGYYFVSAKDVRDGHIYYKNARQIREADFAETHRRTDLRAGDVLITNSGTIGRLAVASNDDVTSKTTFQKSVAILKPHIDRVTSRFLYYSLAANAEVLTNAAGGAAQKNLLLGDLRRIAIPVPKLIIQYQIANFLSTYDDLIENNRRRMALLEDSARFLYREWFVRLRFPGYEHTPIVDGVPQGWERKTLGEVARINQTSLGGTFDGEIEYIDIASVSPNSINETTRHQFRDAPGRARRVVRHGDIIWSCVRPNRRSHAVIWQPSENLIASTGFVVISPVSLPASFFYQTVTTDLFVGYLETHAKGAAYPAVVAGDFERTDLLVPPSALLTAFNEFAEPLLSQAHNLRMQNQKLRTARDLLLPRLMSGELAV